MCPRVSLERHRPDGERTADWTHPIDTGPGKRHINKTSKILILFRKAKEKANMPSATTGRGKAAQAPTCSL